MLYFLSTAFLLGLSAGLAPGPLLTLVMSETLRHGSAAGIRSAIAPLITDAPIVLLCLFVLSRIDDSRLILGILSLGGAVIVLMLAYECLRARPPDPDIGPGSAQSLMKGVLVNFTNPQPYLFWMAVGGPLLVKAGQISIGLGIAFLAIFYLLLVGLKVLLAILLGRYRHRFVGSIYTWVNRALGVLLGVFAFTLLWEGIDLLGFQ